MGRDRSRFEMEKVGVGGREKEQWSKGESEE